VTTAERRANRDAGRRRRRAIAAVVRAGGKDRGLRKKFGSE
jgi:hypothetical protein